MIFLAILGGLILLLIALIWFTEKPSFILGSVWGMIWYGYDVDWLTLCQTVASHESGEFYKNEKDSGYRKHNNYIGMQAISRRKTTSKGNVTIPYKGSTRTVASYRTPFDCAMDYYLWLEQYNVTKKAPDETPENRIIKGTKFMKDKGYYVEPYNEYRDGCLLRLRANKYPWNVHYWIGGVFAALIILAILSFKGLLSKFR